MSGHGEHESHAGITAEIRARAGVWMDDKLKQYDERLADRLVKSHFSIENLLAFFRANDLSAVKEIWLIHLSKDNANRETFRQAVERETGKMVFVA